MEQRPKTPRLLWAITAILLVGVSGLAIVAWREKYLQKLWDLRPKPEVITPGYYKIIHVYDGDTFAVDMNGTPEKVRLIGIDTPETHKPDTPRQCYGSEAAAYAAQIESDKTVRLESDPTNTNRDRYGRLLRYAYLDDGTFLNQKMIEEGYAFAYTPFAFQKKAEFLALEEAARNSRKGLWSACEVRIQNGVYQTNDAV